MKVRTVSRMAALCAFLVLPLAGPVHADVGVVVDESMAMSLGATAEGPKMVSRPLVQPLPAAPEMVVDASDIIDEGDASYYGRRFAGRPTASGETFDPTRLTAAHRTLPFGSKVRVTYERTGESVIVTINDRGPFHADRVIDLSRAAAEQIGLTRAGHGRVELALLD